MIGFIASNSGESQGIFDVCVSCIDRPRCTLDTDAMGMTENDTCAKVGIIMFSNSSMRQALLFRHLPPVFGSLW